MTSTGVRGRAGALVMGALLTAGLALSGVEGAEIGPETDLCAALEGLQPGEELTLRAGDYRAGCVIRRGGTPGAPVVIRSAEPDQPARLVHPGGEVNVLNIRASDVIVRGLHFGPTASDIDGVRIISGHRIIVEDCRFTRMGGIAVVANHTSVRNLTVRRNVIRDSGATAMYFGCHDGLACSVTGLIVEGNHIRGVTAASPQVGYGVQVKLNSAAIIRDNVILETKGPGIMVYGSGDLVTVSLVERNFVSGSRTSSGIVVGGGPVVIRNNVSGWNVEAGVSLENYARRRLLRAIVVVHNSVYANQEGGIMAPDQGPVEATIHNNAIHARAGTLPLPPQRPGLRMTGNVDCSWAPCFANADALDFSPFPGSILVGRGLAPPEPIVPGDDFFGARRGAPPTIGAVDQPTGPVRLGVKP
jgi:hypothetical protein